MKTQEEIEKLAEKEYREYPNNPLDEPAWHYNKDIHCHKKRKAFINGYTQCQENMQKDVEYWQGEFDHWHQQAMEMSNKYKYTEEDMMLIRNKIVSILPTGDISAWDMIQAVSKYTKWLDEYINSLNKQD